MAKNKKHTTFFRYVKRILLWILLVVAFILVIVDAVLLIPAVQSKVAQMVVDRIDDKVENEVSLDKLRLTLPNILVLNNLYVEDKIPGDTLLYVDRLKVNFDILKLINKNLSINQVVLMGTKGKIWRSPNDSTMNIEHFINQLASEKKQPKPQKEESGGGGFEISVNNIKLQNIDFAFLDSMSRFYLNAHLGNLSTVINSLDYEQLSFGIEQLNLKNTDVSMKMASSEETEDDEEPDTSSQKLVINLEKSLKFENVTYAMNNLSDESSMEAMADFLLLETVSFNLEQQEVTFDNIEIKNSTFSNIQQATSAQMAQEKPEEEETGNESENQWRFSGGEIDLENNDIKLIDYNYPETPGMFNPHHLNIALAAASVDNVLYSPDEINASINELVVTEGNDFHIAEFQADVSFTDKQLTATDVVFKTNKSQIYPKAVVSYPRKAALYNLSNAVQLDVSIEPSTIAVEDVTYFITTEGNFLQDSIPFDRFTVEMSADGSPERINLHQLAVNAGEGTEVNIQGQVNHLSDMENLYADIQLETIRTVYEDYAGFVPASMRTDSFDLPSFVNVTGAVEGQLSDLQANLTVNTNYSEPINVKGKYQSTTGEQTRISASLNVPGLSLGQVMNDTTTFQNLTLNAEVNAVLAENNPVSATATLNVPSVGLKNYQYNDIRLEGFYENDSVHANLSIDDPYLNLDGAFDANFQDSVPVLMAQIALKKLNAQEVNLSESEILANGIVRARIKGTDPDSLNGYVDISDILILKNQQRYVVDRFLVEMINEEDYSKINIDSRMFRLFYEGTVRPANVPKTLLAHIDQYFELPQSIDTMTIEGEQSFDLTAEIHDADIFTNVFLPGLESFEPGKIEIHYNASQDKLNTSVNLPRVLYKNLQVRSLRMTTDSDADEMTYSTKFDQAGTDDYWLQDFLLQGEIANNEIENRLKVASTDSVKYLLKSKLRSARDTMIGILHTDTLILNYKPWKVPDDNQVVIADGEFSFRNFSISRNAQQASLTTVVEDGIEKTRLSFEQFNAKAIGNLITSDEPLISGSISGNTSVWSNPGFGFNSDLTISNLEFLSEPIGDLSMMASNTSENQIDVDVQLSGRNEFTITGKYISGDQEKLNLNAELTNIQLSTMQPFIESNVERIEGKLSGNFAIEGNLDDPSFNGEINLSETEVIPTFIGTLITIKEGGLVLNNEEIVFETFQLRDARDNSASLSGSVNIEQMANPKLDLSFNANNFLLLNTSDAADGEDFFGTAIANLEVEATGSALSPRLNVNVEVLEGTDFTYIVRPQAPAGIEEEGLVEFVKQDTAELAFPSEESADTMATAAGLRSIDLQANVQLNPEAIIHIQLDPISEEQMTLQGTANLSVDKAMNGDLSLVGRYNIQSGQYKLKLYQFLSREFEIEEGSYIVWSGDPMDARANLTAVYSVETSPAPLLPEATDDDNNISEQNEFFVDLNITGQLTSPEISFNLDVAPELTATQIAGIIQNINQNETRLNKQVFSLLLFQRFMSDEMFAGGNGFNQRVTTTAREGLNNLVSDQLTRFAERYVQGFDISLDIDSYENREQTNNSALGNTQVQLNVSKTLFDERLTVRVGGNVNLSDSEEQPVPGQTQTGFLGDVAIIYELTENGNVKLKAFNKTVFEDVIDGEVNKTGVSILYQRDFYKFMDIFDNRKKKKNLPDTDEK